LNEWKCTNVPHLASNVLPFEKPSKRVATLVVCVISDPNHKARPRALLQKHVQMFLSGALIAGGFLARRNVELYFAEFDTTSGKVGPKEIVRNSKGRAASVAIHQFKVDEENGSGGYLSALGDFECSHNGKEFGKDWPAVLVETLENTLIYIKMNKVTLEHLQNMACVVARSFVAGRYDNRCTRT
jgi:hypothetical protein